MKRWVLLLLFCLLLLVSCTTKSKESEKNTLYPKMVTMSGDRIWYTTQQPWNGIRYYDIKTGINGSLCQDSVCDHGYNDDDCVLQNLFVLNLTADDEGLYFLASHTMSDKMSYYKYIFDTQELTRMYGFDNTTGNFSSFWCVSNDDLYFSQLDNEFREHIYRLSLKSSMTAPEEIFVQKNDDTWIQCIENGDIYYFDHGILTRNGDPLVEDVFKLRFEIIDGYIYFSKNPQKPNYSEAEDPERVKGEYWPYDLYRVKLGDDIANAELLIQNVNGNVIVNGNNIYYTPYQNMSIAFSYVVPGGTDYDPMRVFMYDRSGGTMCVYHIDSGESETLFTGLPMIFWDLFAVTEEGIVVRANDYSRVETEGDELRTTTKDAFYDYIGYYLISYDGKEIEYLNMENAIVIQ